MVWDLQTMEHINQKAVDQALNDKMDWYLKQIRAREIKDAQAFQDSVLSEQNQILVDSLTQHIVATIFERVALILQIVDLEVGKKLNEDNIKNAEKIATGLRVIASDNVEKTFSKECLKAAEQNGITIV